MLSTGGVILEVGGGVELDGKGLKVGTGVDGLNDGGMEGVKGRTDVFGTGKVWGGTDVAFGSVIGRVTVGGGSDVAVGKAG